MQRGGRGNLYKVNLEAYEKRAYANILILTKIKVTAAGTYNNFMGVCSKAEQFQSSGRMNVQDEATS
jgi:hypothetical protein